ncbi:hypothetical protein ACFLY7_02150 [Patescibacteria group bacterium]
MKFTGVSVTAEKTKSVSNVAPKRDLGSEEGVGVSESEVENVEEVVEPKQEGVLGVSEILKEGVVKEEVGSFESSEVLEEVKEMVVENESVENLIDEVEEDFLAEPKNPPIESAKIGESLKPSLVGEVKTLKLNIKFGIEIEKRRVNYTLSKLDWYINNGYKPHLPQGIDKNSDDKKIEEQIIKEYNKTDYENTSKKLETDFLIIKDNLYQVLKNIFGENIPIIYDLNLIKYGVGGSYYPPDKIIFNINNERGIKTIVHEMIHLMIEDDIQKYEIGHFEKERIVDLILHSPQFVFLKYDSSHKKYDGADRYVDDLFNKYFFESKEKFFVELASVRKKTEKKKEAQPTIQTPPQNTPKTIVKTKVVEKVVYKTDPNIVKNLLNKARAKIQKRKRNKLDKIMSLFDNNLKITSGDVQKLLHSRKRTTTNYLNQLEAEKRIIQVGNKGKAVFYMKRL